MITLHSMKVQNWDWKMEHSREYRCPLSKCSSASLPLDNLLLKVGLNLRQQCFRNSWKSKPAAGWISLQIETHVVQEYHSFQIPKLCLGK